jgi:hypothetical protein
MLPLHSRVSAFLSRHVKSGFPFGFPFFQVCGSGLIERTGLELKVTVGEFDQPGKTLWMSWLQYAKAKASLRRRWGIEWEFLSPRLLNFNLVQTTQQ